MMTTQQVMALAKEKLGKDLTEQEAQAYIDGKAAIPDEALDIVSGGGCGAWDVCPNCCLAGSSTYKQEGTTKHFTCHSCGHRWTAQVF